ncbi:hypothetical protein NMY22_g10604 [Coprinellus aureogranulatus]|nr:hypothetical protein NMY22_g10604 [Coprinellus aureogranulatus]
MSPSGGYDVVLALSITKWIHLHTLDSGLLAFFQEVHTVLRKGGNFVLEPQGWDSYAKATRKVAGDSGEAAKLKENKEKLELRPDEFGRVLVEIGFRLERRIEDVGEGGFARPIDLYVKL